MKKPLTCRQYRSKLNKEFHMESEKEKRRARLDEAAAEVKARLKKQFGKKQLDAKPYEPLQPRVRRKRGMAVSPHIWGKRVTGAGVVFCQLMLNEHDVFIHRITRGGFHHYHWLVFKATATNVLRGHYECPATYHEARAFNESFGGALGILFRAA
jgi:hypothetical protein